MWSARLIARGRIGMEIFVLIQPKAVAGIGADARFAGKISTGFRGQGLKNALRLRIRVLFQNDIDPACFGRPDAKVRPPGGDHLRADRMPASKFIHVLNSPINADAVALELKFVGR